jgi:hypothetical protein
MRDDLPEHLRDEAVFDRLVDGELSLEETRTLLRSLDQRPDGWRRCALAFLEAQAWSRELRAVQQEAAAAPLTRSKNEFGLRQVAAASAVGRRWPLYLAMAASFLLMFGLGVAFRWRLSWTSQGRQEPSIVRGDQRTAPPDAIVERGEAVPPASPIESLRPQPGSRVRLVMDRGDGSVSESVELPVVELSPQNAWLLSGQGLAIPSEVHRDLQRQGRQLQQRRQFVPVRTQDGRQIVIPVQQWELTPVRGQRYQ